MSIATPEIQARAPELLPDRKRVEGARWHLLHVKSRQEKVLAGTLEGMGIDCFLPLAKQVRYHGKRKAIVREPLFPGYMFLWGTTDDSFEADRTRRVVNLIPVADQEALEWELQNLHHALSIDAPLETTKSVKKGARVMVRSGPFKGIEGVVQRRARRHNLILQVSMLGQALRLEIEESLLNPLD